MVWHKRTQIKVIDRTYISILHGADVRSEATVCWGNNSLHALLLLI